MASLARFEDQQRPLQTVVPGDEVLQNLDDDSIHLFATLSLKNFGNFVGWQPSFCTRCRKSSRPALELKCKFFHVRVVATHSDSEQVPRGACSASTNTHEHEDNHEQLQHRTKPFTMQDIIDAIDQMNRGKAGNTRGVNAEMITYSTRRLRTHLLRLYNKAIKTHEQPPPTWRNTTIKVTCKRKDPSSPSNCRPLVRSRSCTNSLASSSSGVYEPRWTPTSPLTKQASDQATTLLHDHLLTLQQLRQTAAQ